MVRIFRKYTTTFFLWAAGFISVATDMLQKPDVAFYTAIVLLSAGVICLVLGPLFVDRLVSQTLGVKIDADFSSRPFGFMALLLAGAFWTVLTSRLERRRAAGVADADPAAPDGADSGEGIVG